LAVVLRRFRLPRSRIRGKTLKGLAESVFGGAGREESLAIILDDAQDLSEEFLEESRELWAPKQGRFQWVLAGRPELESRLNSWALRALKKGIGFRFRLDPLTEQESRQYVQRRLKEAGAGSDEIFTPEALSLICDHSRGVPRTLNTFCTKALWAGYSFSQKPIGLSLVKDVLEDTGVLLPEGPPARSFGGKLRGHLPARRVGPISFSEQLYDIQKYVHGEVYGLPGNPFEDRSDPGFYFATENCREVWNSILYGLGRRKGFILLAGESGVGKTALLALVSLYLSIRGPKALIPVFRPPENAEEFLRTVHRHLGLSGTEENQDAMLSRITGDLARRASLGEAPTLIFDQAENLKTEILDDIIQLAGLNPETPKFFQAVFGGGGEFEKRLGSKDLSALNQKFEVRSRLMPLSLQESRDYVEHRLKKVGSSAAQLFSPKALSLIIYRAKGFPRTLNQVCYEALSVGFSRGMEKVDLESVRKALVNLGLEK
jgi:general secretion pathway protein A